MQTTPGTEPPRRTVCVEHMERRYKKSMPLTVLKIWFNSYFILCTHSVTVYLAECEELPSYMGERSSHMELARGKIHKEAK